MGIIPSALFISFGFMIGAMLTSVVGRWLDLVIQTLHGPSAHPRKIAAAVSLFHAGPWTLVVVALFAYFEYAERWAQLLGIGVAIWAVVFAILVRRLRATVRKGANAA